MAEYRSNPIHIRRAGERFIRVALAHDRFEVVAGFSNAVHVTAADDYLCLCWGLLPIGPLNGFADAFGAHETAALVVGDRVTFDVLAAQPWSPPGVGKRVSRDHQLELTARVRSRVDRLAPNDGLVRPALRLSPPRTALARLARPRVAAIVQWLDVNKSTVPMQLPPPVDLIGFGPGLTPSGDDFICGVLIALHACGRWNAADALGAAALEAARTATTPYSRAMLAAAMDGEAAEPLHLMVQAIVSQHAIGMEYHIGMLVKHGHTSGWDALAGAVLALESELDWIDPPDAIT